MLMMRVGLIAKWLHVSVCRRIHFALIGGQCNCILDYWIDDLDVRFGSMFWSFPDLHCANELAIDPNSVMHAIQSYIGSMSLNLIVVLNNMSKTLARFIPSLS